VRMQHGDSATDSLRRARKALLWVVVLAVVLFGTRVEHAKSDVRHHRND